MYDGLARFSRKWLFFFLPSLSFWICMQAMPKSKPTLQLFFFFRFSPSSLICNFFYLHWLLLIPFFFCMVFLLIVFFSISSLDVKFSPNHFFSNFLG
jgi:hypothetical protein